MASTAVCLPRVRGGPLLWPGTTGTRDRTSVQTVTRSSHVFSGILAVAVTAAGSPIKENQQSEKQT